LTPHYETFFQWLLLTKVQSLETLAKTTDPFEKHRAAIGNTIVGMNGAESRFVPLAWYERHHYL